MNLSPFLTKVIQDDSLHAKWLNTLSFLENCGARKIAACEHPIFVKEEMLKHASEEFRHSHYLKKQIKKVSKTPLPTYALSSMLGGIHTLQYLNKLDLLVSKFLIKECALGFSEVRKIAYLLVTYAIEVRAQEFYPIYEKHLREQRSNVYVKSIILEEEEHLREMQEGLEALAKGDEYAKKAHFFEKLLFEQWIKALSV